MYGDSLFHFSEIRALDLFSGTGNISYELSSRGTEDITAVDGDSKCTRFINQTSQALDLPIQVIKSDVYKYLQKGTSKPFDLIFADPPYNFEQEKFEEIVKLVFDNNLLKKEGMLIIEHSTHTKYPKSDILSFEKKYGGSVFSFFEYPSEE